ncbi:unnamed protein product [Ceutorhynchus assimilis]|uniref:F-box domain-containing protein n=1 Tax=Ceutorhynchus assimilis TaxID=467358 RepID=A0A9N9QHL2_9CUCU|nr:unnamed protein product [Ceutorhynchus assimilis]
MGSRNRKTKLSMENDKDSVERKRQCRIDYTSLLPNEIMIKIFSLLPHEDLFRNIRCVNKRWYNLTKAPTLWRIISADRKVPSSILRKWIRHSPLLKEISFFNRDDMDVLIEYISKYSSHLQSIIIENCWGNSKNNYIKGRRACGMLKKCPKLCILNFTQTCINSTKFFRILATRAGEDVEPKKYTYIGPITQKQMEALLDSIHRDNKHDLVVSSSSQHFGHIVDAGSPRVTPSVSDFIWNNLNGRYPNE